MLNNCKIWRTHWIGTECVVEELTADLQWVALPPPGSDGAMPSSGRWRHEEATAIASQFCADRVNGIGGAHVSIADSDRVDRAAPRAMGVLSSRAERPIHRLTPATPGRHVTQEEYVADLERKHLF